ncbi:hypothetical protein BHM03_00009349, partial [Ensete ventricosum]
SSDEQTFDLDDTVKTVFPFTSRRMLFASSTLWFCLHTSKYFPVVILIYLASFIVVGNALSKNPNPDEVVARVNILVAEG